MSFEARLNELGFTLPVPPDAGAHYAPYSIAGSLVFISGQAPFVNGTLPYQGKIPSEVPFERGQEAAGICALNMIAVLKHACGGDLSRVRKFHKIGAFVYSDDDFTMHHKITDGATDLLVRVFGEAGLPARFAVGMAIMPLRMTVEIDAVVEIDND